MKIKAAPNKFLLATCAGAALVLTGCSGNTYGTGVSQGQQLVTDIGGLVAIGSRSKKKPIDFSARPSLVKAPADGTLPPPVEKVNSGSGYFPQNPEERRAALRNEADGADEVLARGGTLSPELQAAREDSRSKAYRENVRERQRVAEKNDTESWAEIKAKQEAFRSQKIRREGTSEPAARKYLTQPPVQYRQPAETAPTGLVGDNERDPKLINKPPRKSVLKRIFG